MMADQTFSGVFWNLGGPNLERPNEEERNLSDLLVRLVRERELDVVALTEPHTSAQDILDALREVDDRWLMPESFTQRLQVFARGELHSLRELYGDRTERLTVRSLELGGREYLLAAAHLPDKVNWDEGDQQAEVTAIANDLRGVEDRRGHRRTILIGDLNMNPFERGVVQAIGLHAMMTKASTFARTRTVQKKEYPFFYNPMWGFFGDRTVGPPGTIHHRRSGQHLSYDWDLFDQFLIRPEALEFVTEDVEILTRIDSVDLRDERGIPDRKRYSDHLPIWFQLKVIKS